MGYNTNVDAAKKISSLDGFWKTTSENRAPFYRFDPSFVYFGVEVECYYFQHQQTQVKHVSQRHRSGGGGGINC